jgi:hypothetical protein
MPNYAKVLYAMKQRGSMRRSVEAEGVEPKLPPLPPRDGRCNTRLAQPPASDKTARYHLHASSFSTRNEFNQSAVLKQQNPMLSSMERQHTDWNIPRGGIRFAGASQKVTCTTPPLVKGESRRAKKTPDCFLPPVMACEGRRGRISSIHGISFGWWLNPTRFAQFQ